jgi:hypothetical protein
MKKRVKVVHIKSVPVIQECPYRLISGCHCCYTGNDADMLHHFIVDHFSPLVIRVRELSSKIPLNEEVIVIDDDGEYVLPAHTVLV